MASPNAADPAPKISLPPLLTAHLAQADQVAFDAACAGAQAGELGAGDAVVAPGVRTAAMAIVLEPEVSARAARQMGPLAMVAMADSLGALLPPKVSIEHRWPDVLLLNRGETGAIRLALAPGADDDVPDWLVIGFELRLAFGDDAPEPGATVGTTCLAEEGGEALLAEELLASIAAHTLTWLDIWQTDGFAAVVRAWTFRAEGRREPARIATAGGALDAQVIDLEADVRLRVKDADGGEWLLGWPGSGQPERTRWVPPAAVRSGATTRP